MGRHPEREHGPGCRRAGARASAGPTGAARGPGPVGRRRQQRGPEGAGGRRPRRPARPSGSGRSARRPGPPPTSPRPAGRARPGRPARPGRSPAGRPGGSRTGPPPAPSARAGRSAAGAPPPPPAGTPTATTPVCSDPTTSGGPDRLDLQARRQAQRQLEEPAPRRLEVEPGVDPRRPRLERRPSSGPPARTSGGDGSTRRASSNGCSENWYASSVAGRARRSAGSSVRGSICRTPRPGVAGDPEVARRRDPDRPGLLADVQQREPVEGDPGRPCPSAIGRRVVMHQPALLPGPERLGQRDRQPESRRRPSRSRRRAAGRRPPGRPARRAGSSWT